MFIPPTYILARNINYHTVNFCALNKERIFTYNENKCSKRKCECMKVNKLTLGSNQRWESSRMMLPEHVIALQRLDQEEKKKKRPELDESQVEEIEWKVRCSLNNTLEIEVTVFGEYEDRTIKGIVDKIDTQLMRIKLELEDGETEWVDIGDILGIENI
jgi:hypothetical protein